MASLHFICSPKERARAGCASWRDVSPRLLSSLRSAPPTVPSLRLEQGEHGLLRIGEGEVLADQAGPRAGRDPELALEGLLAGDHAQQRGLSRAVFAKERHAVPAAQGKGRAGEQRVRAKALAKVLRLEDAAAVRALALDFEAHAALGLGALGRILAHPLQAADVVFDLFVHLLALARRFSFSPIFRPLEGASVDLRCAVWARWRRAAMSSSSARWRRCPTSYWWSCSA